MIILWNFQEKRLIGGDSNFHWKNICDIIMKRKKDNRNSDKLTLDSPFIAN
jgi:hypothetical protein